MPFAAVNGTELYYELSGETGEAVVLLNGISMSTAAWGWQVPALRAAGFRVLAYDLRGQLQSGKPEQGTYTMAQHSADLAALLDLLAIPVAHLVGISYGGAVAQHVALDHPARVGKLVLADTLAWSDEVNRAIGASWFEAAERGLHGMRFDMSLPLTFGDAYLRNNAAQLAKLREWSIQQPWQPLARLVKGMLGHDVRDRLASITATTLVIVGRDDRFTPLYHSIVLKDGIPSATLAVIDDCGHASCLERPDVFNRLVLDFLQER